MRDTVLMQRVMAMTEVLHGLLAEKPDVQEWSSAFPRDMERLILYGLEIPIIRLPHLTVRAAAHYLCVLRGEANLTSSEVADRDLYGLLHVGPPGNLIFVRTDLPICILNYVLSHELGHFVTDVFFIQQLWLKTFPGQKDAIQRAFTWQDCDAQLELRVLIKDLPPRPKPIIGRGQAMTPEATEREIHADLFAREFMAPWDVVSPLFRANNRQEFVSLLCEQFGLPLRIAAYYDADLRRHLASQPDILDRLFAPLLAPAQNNS